MADGLKDVSRDDKLDEGQDPVDVSLIRWMLSLTPDERLAVLQGFVDSAAELRHAFRRT